MANTTMSIQENAFKKHAFAVTTPMLADELKQALGGSFKGWTFLQLTEDIHFEALSFIGQLLANSDTVRENQDQLNISSSPGEMSSSPEYWSYTAKKKLKKANTDAAGVVYDVKLTAGQGVHHFKWNNIEFVASKTVFGLPAGNNAKEKAYVTLCTKGENKIKELESLVAEMISNKEATAEEYYIYTFNSMWAEWVPMGLTRGRKESTVILQQQLKQKLLKDVETFLTEETKQWYFDRGIPYKRTFLFHGVPGCGKTSIISVLAQRFNRAVCILSPADKTMDDNKLKAAIMELPSNALVILEDVDGFFTGRSSNMANRLTFSGLLNALDGVGSGMGNLFILTTNHRERLDHALIRSGRIDMQIEFGEMDKSMLKQMFDLFFPSETDERDLGGIFTDRVFELLEAEKQKPNNPQLMLTPAIAQGFFIRHREAAPGDILDRELYKRLIETVKKAPKGKKENERAPRLKNGLKFWNRMKSFHQGSRNSNIDLEVEEDDEGCC